MLKKRGDAMRTGWLIPLVFTASLGLQGCETLQGTATGFAGGLKKDAENISTSAESFAQNLVEADSWMQKNLW